MIRRIAREIVVGASSLVPQSKRELAVPLEVEYQRHELEESVQLLNAMRRAGGVRRIGRGCGDNGAPVGQISERVMRHTNFEAINERIMSEGVEFEDRDPIRPSAQQVDVIPPAPRFQSRPKGPVITLQDELFGR